MSKKARKGGPSRKRKVPKPILPDFPTAGMATAVCPHCGDRFGTEAIVGGWLDRRCPLCGGILRTSCCDEAALRFLREMKEIESDLAAKRRKSDEAQRRIDSHRRWWQAPYRWYRNRVRTKADGEKELANEALREAQARYDSARYARFHTSEWHLCTHIPVEKEFAEGGSYRLIPMYDENGRFFLGGSARLLRAGWRWSSRRSRLFRSVWRISPLRYMARVCCRICTCRASWTEGILGACGIR